MRDRIDFSENCHKGIGSKTIVFEMHNDDDEIVRIEKTFLSGTTWMEISSYYYNFLVGMGYHLKPQDVGAR